MISLKEQHLKELKGKIDNLEELLEEDNMDELLEKINDLIISSFNEDWESTPESLKFQAIYDEIFTDNF